MASPVAVLRLGRDAAALLVAEPGPSGLAVVALLRREGECVGTDGRPTAAASGHIASMMSEAGVPSVYVVMPLCSAPLKRADVTLPSPGTIRSSTIEEGLRQTEEAMSEPEWALLSNRPYAYEADGEVGVTAPLGLRAAGLTMRVAGTVAQLSDLRGLDRTVTQAGFAVEGVVPAADALAAVPIDGADGTFICVLREETLTTQCNGGVPIASFAVPIGRRHMESDLAQAFALEAPEAARRTDAALVGTLSDDRALNVIAKRIDELSDLIRAGAASRGIELEGARLAGLPKVSAGRVAGAMPMDLSGLPRTLGDEPLLGGAAMIALGLRGDIGRPVLPAAKKRSPLEWLISRF